MSKNKMGKDLWVETKQISAKKIVLFIALNTFKKSA